MDPKKPLPEIDPNAPATDAELEAAADLRAALEDPARASVDADFARALALAHAPREIDPAAHARIVEQAMARGEHAARERARRGVVVRVTFGVATLFAAAAAVLLMVRPRGDQAAPSRDVSTQLVSSRSTQSLFADPFALEGGESGRIDRIAQARASDLRANRFAKWGVR